MMSESFDKTRSLLNDKSLERRKRRTQFLPPAPIGLPFIFERYKQSMSENRHRSLWRRWEGVLGSTGPALQVEEYGGCQNDRSKVLRFPLQWHLQQRLEPNE